MQDRPFISNSVVDLELLFAKTPSDTQLLANLLHELTFRHVPRAQALYQKVSKAFEASSATAPAAVSPEAARLKTILEKARAERKKSPQHELFNDPHPIAESASVQSEPSTSPLPRAQPKRQVTPPSVSTVVETVMSVEEAYRMLKATPGIEWEVIEMTRRQIVQHSSPTDSKRLDDVQRIEALALARRANNAYAVLFELRRATSG